MDLFISLLYLDTFKFFQVLMLLFSYSADNKCWCWCSVFQ